MGCRGMDVEILEIGKADEGIWTAGWDANGVEVEGLDVLKGDGRVPQSQGIRLLDEGESESSEFGPPVCKSNVAHREKKRSEVLGTSEMHRLVEDRRDVFEKAEGRQA
jgi:hypothetical protein